MSQPLPWIVALVSLLLAAGLGAGWWWLNRRGRKTRQPLPSAWPLGPRPLFNADERRVYRQLREALPHHIVLAKVPMVRFCQPNNPEEVRHWYGIIGSIHVTFAVCSANGRVLAAIDLDNDRANSSRVLQIKEGVLAACQIRYLRCPVDHLPSVPELQLLVPQAGSVARAPQAAPAEQPWAHSTSAGALSGAAAPTARRRTRQPLWRDSEAFQSASGTTAAGPRATPADPLGLDADSGPVPLTGRTVRERAAEPSRPGPAALRH